MRRLLADKMTGKENSVSGLPLLGTGRTAEIYALDEKLALKLYFRQIPRENAVRNYHLLQASREAGIPVPAVYEMVKVCDRDGMIMERLEGESVDELIAGAGQPDRGRITAHFADCVRQVHQVRVEKEHLKDLLPDQKERSLELADAMTGAGFTEEERNAACEILASLPDCDTWIHGDCHTGNVVLCGEEPVFFDLNIFTGRGHPLLDLMCMYSHYIFHPSLMREEEVFQYLGMSSQEGRDVYDRFLEAYTRDQQDPGQESLRKLRSDIIFVHAARISIMAALNPRLFSPRAVEKARKKLNCRWMQKNAEETFPSPAG